MSRAVSRFSATFAVILFAHLAQAEVDFYAEASNEGVTTGIKYTSSSFKEFLWGFTRPVHLWNTEPNGEREILPFYTSPLKPGGLLSWLTPSAWQDNPSLTLGTLLSEIVITFAIIEATESDGSNDAPPPSNPTQGRGSSSGSDKQSDGQSQQQGQSYAFVDPNNTSEQPQFVNPWGTFEDASGGNGNTIYIFDSGVVYDGNGNVVQSGGTYNNGTVIFGSSYPGQP